MPEKIYTVNLTEDERTYLLNLFKGGRHPARKLNRARILLLADEGKTDEAIEAALARQGIDPERVQKRDFDQIRRLHIKLSDINAKAQAQIAKVQGKQVWSTTLLILELNQISLNLKIAQGLVPAPEVQEGRPVAAVEPVIETTAEKQPGDGGEAPSLEALVPEMPNP